MNASFNKSDFQKIEGILFFTRYEYIADDFRIEIEERYFNDETISYMQKFVELYPIKIKEIAKTLSRFERLNPNKDSVEQFVKRLWYPDFLYNPCYITIIYETLIDEVSTIYIKVYGLYEDFSISIEEDSLDMDIDD